jgi:hypothetical protein
MAAESLQQLRDIHLPPPPGWWPPAPGWWLVGLLAAAACAWLIWRVRMMVRRRRPLRQARRLHAQMFQRLQDGEISGRDYVHQCNELLKRVLIHGLGEDAARRVSGAAWLDLLDAHMGETAFSEGPGAVLGNARFRPEVQVDASAVHARVESLLARLTRQATRVRG